MSSTLRYDFAPIQGYEVTPEGYLRVHAKISRTGIQNYLRSDGSTRREYRPEEEVKNPDSLTSFASKVVTLEHPPVLLDADNTKKYQVGFTGSEVTYDSGFVRAVVTLTDKDAIKKVMDGEYREVSAGYRVEFDETPGIAPDGQAYDGIQRQIMGNHVSLVRKGRAGPEVRLLMDSEDGAAIQMDGSDDQSIQIWDDSQSIEDTIMTKVTIDGLEFEASEALALAIQQTGRSDEAEKAELNATIAELQSKLDEAVASLEAIKAEKEEAIQEFDKLQGKADAMQEKIDSLEAEARTDVDIDSLVAARMELISKATPFVGKEFKFDGLSTRQVQEAVIKAVCDGADMESRTDEYVMARFDAVLELNQRIDSSAPLREAVAKVNSDAQPSADAIVRQKLADAWKRPLTAHK